MRCLAFALGLLLLDGEIARAIPADCQPHALAPKPANLANILKDHSRWLATWDTPRPKGSQADLSYRDLTGVVLSDADLRRVKLTGSKLQGAKLERARLDEAELACVLADSASFAGADLFKATLTNASLVGADLTQAKLGGAILYGAELVNTRFLGADMRRAMLGSAALRNTWLKDARFDDVDLLGALWQPVDLPEVSTMGSVAHLSTIKLDPANPDPGAMSRLVVGLRDVGLDDRAKEVAHARERAMVALDLAKWRKDPLNVIALGWAVVRGATGLLTDYGLALSRGLLIAVAWNLVFVLLYYRWGFSSAVSRRAGIVRIIPEKTLVASPKGERLTKEDKVVPLAPATWLGRLLWASLFAIITAVRSGIGPINMFGLVEWLASSKIMGATGWLHWAANVQSFISLLLIGCFGYAYLL